MWIGGCGGSLIRLDWVLTAAHCIGSPNDPGFPRATWCVRAGSRNLDNEEGEVRFVPSSSVYVHENYTANENVDDYHGFGRN